MREILFKGKRIDNGDWVFGSLLSDNKVRACIVPSGTVIGLFKYGFANVECVVEVQKDTVCQYTGLTDKNGKKIFEGDILQGHSNKNELCKVVLGGFYIIDVETLEKVEYVNGWHTEVISTDALSKTEPFCLDMPLTDFYIERSEFEVVGNIHDNPDLLTTSPIDSD